MYIELDWFCGYFSQETNTSNLRKQLQCLQKYFQAILQWSKDKGSLVKIYKCVQSTIYELEDILKLWRGTLLYYQESEAMIKVICGGRLI